MNDQELKKLFAELWYNGKDDKLLDMVLTLPERDLDEELIFWVPDMYIEIDEYYKSACALDVLHSRFGNTYQWHFRMGKTYLYASMSDDLQNNAGCRRILLDNASAAFKAAIKLNPSKAVREEADEFFELISEESEELQFL